MTLIEGWLIKKERGCFLFDLSMILVRRADFELYTGLIRNSLIYQKTNPFNSCSKSYVIKDFYTFVLSSVIQVCV